MKNSSSNVTAPPRAILIIGGPGSGKTTISRSFLEDGIVRIDPDAIREGLPEYEELRKQRDPEIVEATRAATTRLSDEKLDDAIQNRRSFVFDASGRDREWYIGLIRRLSAAGFEVTVAMAFTRQEVARERCVERAQINGRFVSEDYFQETHTRIPANFIQYIHEADRFILMRTDTEKPVWVWYRTASGDVLQEPGYLQAFIDRLADGNTDVVGNIPPDPALRFHDGWFEKAREHMESLPAWDLSLETTYTGED